LGFGKVLLFLLVKRLITIKMVRVLSKYSLFVVFICSFSSNLLFAGTIHKISYSFGIAGGTITTSTGKNVICWGGSITLTANPAPAGVIYQWTKGGMAITGATMSTYVVDDSVQPGTAGGDYSVMVIDAKGNVTIYTAITLTVDPQLQPPTFTYTPVNCANSPVQFTGPAGFSTYSWVFGDGGTSNSQNPAHNFVIPNEGSTTTPGSLQYTVTLTVTDANGCSSTSAANTVTLPLPNADLGGPGTHDNFTSCTANQAATLTFSNLSGTAATNTSYDINWNDGTPDYVSATFSTTVSHTFPIGNSTFFFTVTGPNGCTTKATCNVFVGTNPAITLGDPGNTTICTGDALTFPITGTANNPPGTVYTVTFSDGSAQIVYNSTNLPANITHTFKTNSCGYSTPNYFNAFSVSILAANPCNTSLSTVEPIYVSQKADASFTIPATTACVNSAVNFTSTGIPAVSASAGGCINPSAVWNISPNTGWTLSAGSLGNTNGSTDPNLWLSGAANIQIVFNVAGTYTISYQTGNGTCGTDMATQTICINPAPTATFTVDNTLGCEPLTVNTTNTSILPTCGNNQYQWTVGYSNPGCSTNTSGYSYLNGTSATSANPQFQFNNPGLYTLGLTTTGPGGCTATSAAQQITVKSKPVVTISPIAAICQYNSISPAAVVANCYSTATPTYLWTFTGGTPSTSTSANPGTITYSSAGMFTVSLAVTSDCGTTTATQQVVVNPASTVNVPGPITLCSGSASGPITFTSPTNGTTFNWTSDNPSILIGPGIGNIPSFVAVNNGNTSQVAHIMVTPVNINGCTGLPVPFTITVNPEPAAPAANTSYTYCLNDIATPLSATAASGNTLNWYTSAALTNGSQTPPVPVTSVAGSTNYYVTQVNNLGCESPATVITVTVNPVIANNSIGSNQTICSGSQPAALSATATISGGDGTYNYQWQMSTDNGVTWNNTGTSANDMLASYQPGLLTVTTQFRRMVTSATCTSTSNIITISVQGALINFDVIFSTQTICGGTIPRLLTGQTPSGGNGIFTYQWQGSADNVNWSVIPGAIGLNYQPPALTATTYYQRITTSSTCTGVSSTVTVTVNPTPVVNIIPNQIVCNGSTVPAINFNSTPANNITFAWTNDNIAIGVPASGSGGIVSFTAVNTTKAPITANITVTATYTGGGISCNGPPITFSITVLPTIDINPNPGTTVCAGDVIPAFVPVNDAASFPNSSVTYMWTGGGAIGLNDGSGNQVPSFTAMNSGTASLIATIMVTPVYNYNGQACNGGPINYTITVNAAPTPANAGINDKTCSTTYQLNGNTPVVGIGTWTQTAGPAMVFTNPNMPTTTVTGLQKGMEYQFAWTIANSPCAPGTSTVTIDVLRDIVNAIKSDVPSICPGQSVNLSTATLSGGDVPGILTPNYVYNWESSPNGTTGWQAIGNGTSATATDSPAATTWYRLTVSSYGQCAVTSNVIEIIVNPPPPVAVAGNPITLCSQTQAQLNGNNPGTGFTGTWTDSAPGSTLTFTPDANTYNATVNNLVPGNNYNLVWTIASPTCGSTSSTLTINDLAPITNQISPLVSTICFGQSVTITGAIPTGGSGTYQYSWESSPDNITWTVISGQSGQNITLTPSATTYLRRNVTSGPCNLESNAVQIIVQPPLSNNTISAGQQVCTGKPVQQLTGSVPLGGDGIYFYQWQQSTDLINWADTLSLSTTQVNLQPVLLTQTTWYRRVVTTALCAGPQSNASLPVQIVIDQNAISDFSASIQVGCAPFDLQKVITPVPHNAVDGSYQWFANGTAIGTGSAFPGYIIPADGQSVTITLVTTSQFGCNSSSLSLVFSTVKNVTPSFTKDQVKGCGPLLVNFTNTSTPLNGGNYVWNFGNGQTSTQAQPAPVTFLQNPSGADTTYVITLTANTSSGCSTSVYTDSVLVRPLPKAIFTPDKTIGCSPFTINITNQSTGVPNTYTFDFGNGNKQVVTNNQPIQYTYITAKTDTFTLKLTAQNQCGIDSSSYKIVVFPNSVHANLVVNGNNVVGCAPFTVNFFNNSTGANVFNYDFNDGTTAATNQSPETVTHTFTQAGIYNVKLIASNGCSTDTTKQTIKVLAQPVVDFAVKQLQYCVNNAVAFINNTDSLSSFSYLWDFGDGTPISNQVNPQHQYATQGTFTIKLTATQNSNGATCSGTITHNVTIVPLPVATFTSTAGTLNCAPFLLTVNSTPANASSVSWNFGDTTKGAVNTAAGYSAQHLFTKPGLYQVKELAYNPTGCLDSTIQIVQVTETPVAAFTPGDSTICGNSGTISFINTSTYGGTDLLNFKWYINNGLVSNQKNLTYTFNTPSGVILPYIFQVKMVAYSTIGCPDTVTHTIQFNPLPVASYSVTSNIGCVPFKLNITNNSSYADSYKWYLNNVLVDTGKTPASIVLSQPNQAYTLKLVTTNRYACRADSVTKTVSTYPNPVASFTLQDSLSCNGLLNLNATNASTGASSYTWSFGDGTADFIGTTPAHIYGKAGIYKLQLIATNGSCPDTAFHIIQIANPPKAAFTANALKGCDTLFVSFQNLSVNATSYKWDFGDKAQSTVKNPVHTYTYTNSPYKVTLIATGNFGCSDTSVIVNYITVNEPPRVDFTALPDSVIKIPDYTFNFQNNTIGDSVNYSWDFGDNSKITDSQNPSHTYLDTGTYHVKLSAVDINGCSSLRIRTVKIIGVPQYVYVPNAFEPGNAKAELQTFNILGSGMKEYTLRIFNKWGQLLFQSNELDANGSPVQGWNGFMAGQPAPQDVYVWQIHAVFLDNTEWRGMRYKDTSTPSTTGIIHLIR
jgi:PKD repeat protein